MTTYRPQPAGLPTTYSSAPFPMMTERSLVRIQWMAQDNKFASVEAINQFLQSPQGMAAIQEVKPTDSLEVAWDLAYDAWEAPRQGRRYTLARQALELDARVGDAHLILAERELGRWNRVLRCFRRALEATDTAARDGHWFQDLKPDDGMSYWDVPVLRRLLRPRQALARWYMEGGDFYASRDLYDEILRLDPEGHGNVPWEAIQVYHHLGEIDGVRRIAERLGQSASCFIPYERLWLAILGQLPEDPEPLFQEAMQANPHVFRYLTDRGALRSEVRIEGPYIRTGSPEEACVYVIDAHRWWLQEPRARAWIDRGAHPSPQPTA